MNKCLSNLIFKREEEIEEGDKKENKESGRWEMTEAKIKES
jgi:hypothetical protein